MKTALMILVLATAAQAAPVTISEALAQQQPQISGTICDCGEIREGGMSPWWWLLAATPAVCLTGICTPDHHPPPPPVPLVPTSTPTPQPVPEPETWPVVAFVFSLWFLREQRKVKR